jgi:hypothetical protein
VELCQFNVIKLSTFVKLDAMTYNPIARTKLSKPASVRTAGELKADIMILADAGRQFSLIGNDDTGRLTLRGSPPPVPALSNIDPPPGVGSTKSTGFVYKSVMNAM